MQQGDKELAMRLIDEIYTCHRTIINDLMGADVTIGRVDAFFEELRNIVLETMIFFIVHLFIFDVSVKLLQFSLKRSKLPIKVVFIEVWHSRVIEKLSLPIKCQIENFEYIVGGQRFCK